MKNRQKSLKFEAYHDLTNLYLILYLIDVKGLDDLFNCFFQSFFESHDLSALLPNHLIHKMLKRC